MLYLFIMSNKHIDYPLINKYITYTITDINKLANNSIKNIKILHKKPKYIKYKLIPYKNKIIIIKDNEIKNLKLNMITDYFTQYERINCRFNNNDTPYEYYQKNKKELDIKFNLDNPSYTDILNFNEDIYYNAKSCTNFKISECYYLLNVFKPKRYLDISSGWGDRLISALIYGVKEYFGCDPNINLQYGYNKINNFFNSSKKIKVDIKQCGFEELKIPHSKYDLVLTSPPFFTLEIYSSDKNDSVTKYNTMDKWYNNFLIPSLNKAASHLKKGGYMVIYIIIQQQYIKKMIQDVKNITFKGCIYYRTTLNTKSIRPLYIWQK